MAMLTASYYIKKVLNSKSASEYLTALTMYNDFVADRVKYASTELIEAVYSGSWEKTLHSLEIASTTIPAASLKF